MRRAVTALGAAGTGALLYGVLIERNAFTVRRFDVPVLAPGAEPIRILHLADLWRPITEYLTLLDVRINMGGYFMIATAQVYGYDFVKRFGNMVLAMKMHPRFCDRPDADKDKEPCVVTARVRGTKFVTISKK